MVSTTLDFSDDRLRESVEKVVQAGFDGPGCYGRLGWAGLADRLRWCLLRLCRLKK
jgi:hypothetical protein